MKKNSKWSTTVILSELLLQVKEFCKDPKNGFANASQFINFALRKELDHRQR